uniref:Secreted protein n=1 Tax=Rhizophora mucronata TaxID=61149 RepID=A0A2P2K8G9_RHIMU
MLVSLVFFVIIAIFIWSKTEEKDQTTFVCSLQSSQCINMLKLCYGLDNNVFSNEIFECLEFSSMHSIAIQANKY